MKKTETLILEYSKWSKNIEDHIFRNKTIELNYKRDTMCTGINKNYYYICS